MDDRAKKALMTKRAVGYVRASTGDQELTLEHQDSKIRAAAELHDLYLTDVIIDSGESAKSLHRPGAEMVLSMVRNREVEVVIVHKLDRLTRSVRDLGEVLELLEKHGVDLISVTESLDTGSAAGRLVINIMGSVAQWEREAIGERTKAALAVKKARGERVGGIPYGLQLEVGGALMPNIFERDVLSRMRRLRHDGATFQQVADHLNQLGIVTRGGGRFTRQRVHSLLKV